jgi:hypothetical protein
VGAQRMQQQRLSLMPCDSTCSYVSTFFAIFSSMKMGCTQLCKCHLCSKEKLCLPKGLLLIASWCIVQETRKSGTQANELNVPEIPLRRRWSNTIHSRYLESLECANIAHVLMFCDMFDFVYIDEKLFRET